MRRAYPLLVVLVGLLVLYIFLKGPINGYERAMFVEQIDGEAYKPFVKRCLVPALTRGITSLVPAETRETWVTALPKTRAGAEFLQRGWETEHAPEYFAAFVVMAMALFGFTVSLRALTRVALGTSPSLASSISLLGTLCLPAFFRYYNYPYDFMTLFLFTLGLTLLAGRRWLPFLVVFTIGCFNKETIVLLSQVYLLNEWQGIRQRDRMTVGLLAAQLLLFLGSQAWLAYHFRENRGGFVEVQWGFNFFRITSGWHFTGLLVVAAIAVLVFHGWSDKPRFLKRAASVAIPLLGLALSFGRIDEWRDYYEAFPGLGLLAGQTLGRCLGVRIPAEPLTTASPDSVPTGGPSAGAGS